MWSDMDNDAPTSTKLARIINVATTITVFLMRFSFTSSFLLAASVDRKWRGRPEVVSGSESTRTAGRTTLVVVALTPGHGHREVIQGHYVQRNVSSTMTLASVS